ncbi:hypothetical protein [Nocardia sp. NPDC051570]|uniref:hypothetical protein n=1 Tax=Nocardia sp. NPDC051570 TaxID=3364324 RepID=UPI0037AEC476
MSTAIPATALMPPKSSSEVLGRLRLFFLPGYLPELNSDEWVWKNVKADHIGEADVTSKEYLKIKATGALLRLQKLPALVRGFFRDPNLAYLTARLDLLTNSLINVHRDNIVKFRARHPQWNADRSVRRPDRSGR